MSSDSDMDSDPSTPPKPDVLPCMFTVEQFLHVAPSQEIYSEPSNVYIVRPTAIWDSLERFKQVVSTYQPLPSPPSRTANVHLVENEHYRLHDIVTVTRHDLPKSPLWTAHILEIRGHSTYPQSPFSLFRTKS